MLKLAYELGIQKALEEEGITKEAFWGALGGAATKGIAGLGNLASRGAGALGQVPGGSKMLEMAAKNPLAAKTLGGGAVGGVTGGLFGDEGGMARGALMGAGMGAGAHLGAKAMLGKGGGAAQKYLPGLAPEAAGAGARAAGAGAAGAAGAGALGYGMSGAMVPGRDRQPPPWARY